MADNSPTALLVVDGNEGLDPGVWGRPGMEAYAGTLALSTSNKGKTMTFTTLPAGFTPFFGFSIATESLGSASFTVGIAGTIAKYRAAGVQTAVDIPQFFMEAALCGVLNAAAEAIIATEDDTANIGTTGTWILGMIGTRRAV